MRRQLIFAAILLGVCTGCTAMEDFILGPDPAIPDVCSPQVAPANCAAPPPTVTRSQTQEPPLLPAGR